MQTLVNTARRLLRSPVVDVLVGPHGIDRYLELIRPDLTVHEARAELVAVRHQTARSVTLTLRPNSAWRGFRAGQFVPFGIEIDGIRRTRTFSPACSQLPGPTRELEFTITLRPHGLVSGHLRSCARPGAIIHLGVAQGTFTLPHIRPARLFLISGGSGVTPVLSMLRTLCDETYAGEVVFVHYARTAADWLYREEVQQLARRHRNLRVEYRATREGGGYATAASLTALGGDLNDSHVAVCGPPRLIDAVRGIWQGFPGAGRVLTETFAPPSQRVDHGAPTGSLKFLRTGATVQGATGTLLELAEAAGLSPEFGCRMGICGTCRCRKASGPVRNVLTDEISRDLDEDIRLCVSAPAGHVEIEL